MRHRFDRVSLIVGLLTMQFGLWSLFTGSNQNWFALPWRLLLPLALLGVAVAVLSSLRPHRRPEPPAPAPEPLDPLVAEALRELDGPGYDPLGYPTPTSRGDRTGR